MSKFTRSSTNAAHARGEEIKFEELNSASSKRKITPLAKDLNQNQEELLSGDDEDNNLEAAQQRNSPSSENTGSSQEKLGGRPTKKSRVSTGSGGILAPDQRGRTEVGPQVEHASAYVLFEELIYSNLEGVKIADAPTALAEVFKCLPLSDAAIQEIQKMAGEAQEVVSRDERKAATRSIRGANYLAEQKDFLQNLLQEKLASLVSGHQEEEQKIAESLKGLERISQVDVSLVKDAIKLANRSNFSSVVAGIMDECVFGANKMPYVSLPIEGIAPNPNTGLEKTAKNNLKLLSDFLLKVKEANSIPAVISISSSSSNISPEQQKKITENKENLKQDTQLIKKLRENWGIDDEQTRQLIDGEILPDDIFDNVAEKISQHIGQLFYYPKIDPAKMHEYKIGNETKKWSVSQEDWGSVMQKRKYNVGTKPRTNDPEILFELTGRHLVLVFNCFGGLGCFEEENQRRVVDSFLEKSVLEEQEWGSDFGLGPSSSSANQGEMNFKSLEVGIENHAILDYQRGLFYAFGSSRDQQEKGQNISTQTEGMII